MKEWARKSFTLLFKYTTKDVVEKSIENPNMWLRNVQVCFLFAIFVENTHKKQYNKHIGKKKGSKNEIKIYRFKKQ